MRRRVRETEGQRMKESGDQETRRERKARETKRVRQRKCVDWVRQVGTV